MYVFNRHNFFVFVFFCRSAHFFRASFVFYFSSNFSCDTWESSQGQWCRTVLVLRHIREMLRQKYSQKSNLHNSSATIDNNNGINEQPSSSSKKRRSDNGKTEMNK